MAIIMAMKEKHGLVCVWHGSLVAMWQPMACGKWPWPWPCLHPLSLTFPQ